MFFLERVLKIFVFRHVVYVLTFNVAQVNSCTYVSQMLFDVSMSPIIISKLRYSRSHLVRVLLLHYKNNIRDIESCINSCYNRNKNNELKQKNNGLVPIIRCRRSEKCQIICNMTLLIVGLWVVQSIYVLSYILFVTIICINYAIHIIETLVYVSLPYFVISIINMISRV